MYSQWLFQSGRDSPGCAPCLKMSHRRDEKEKKRREGNTRESRVVFHSLPALGQSILLSLCHISESPADARRERPISRPRPFFESRHLAKDGISGIPHLRLLKKKRHNLREMDKEMLPRHRIRHCWKSMWMPCPGHLFVTTTLQCRRPPTTLPLFAISSHYSVRSAAPNSTTLRGHKPKPNTRTPPPPQMNLCSYRVRSCQFGHSPRQRNLQDMSTPPLLLSQPGAHKLQTSPTRFESH